MKYNINFRAFEHPPTAALVTIGAEQSKKSMNYIKYEMVVYWSEDDDAYIADVPELPGCMADGRTYEEAIKKILTVIKEWIETAMELGREIPKPRGRLIYA